MSFVSWSRHRKGTLPRDILCPIGDRKGLKEALIIITPLQFYPELTIRKHRCISPAKILKTLITQFQSTGALGKLA